MVVQTLIALFRGINVGGRHILPMQALREILAELGCENVQTYIQSGNAVFQGAQEPDALAKAIGAAVEERFGFRPRVLVLTAERLRAIAAANPYADAAADPKFVHVLFLAGPPDSPDLDGLDAVKAATESWQLEDRAFYLHAPAGIGRSKLAAKVEQALGVEATGRNWRTVTKLLELAG